MFDIQVGADGQVQLTGRLDAADDAQAHR